MCLETTIYKVLLRLSSSLGFLLLTPRMVSCLGFVLCLDSNLKMVIPVRVSFFCPINWEPFTFKMVTDKGFRLLPYLGAMHSGAQMLSDPSRGRGGFGSLGKAAGSLRGDGAEQALGGWMPRLKRWRWANHHPLQT